jgi:hypothetical protein
LNSNTCHIQITIISEPTSKFSAAGKSDGYTRTQRERTSHDDNDVDDDDNDDDDDNNDDDDGDIWR